MAKFLIFILFNVLVGLLKAGRIPLKIPESEVVEERMEFDLMLPNKDVVQVDLYVRLMKKDTEKPITTTSTTARTIDSTTPEYRPYGDDDDDDEPHMVTKKEAIDAFKQELIRKEANISGIIESEHTFYRHFQLEHGGSVIRIRCTYDSNFEKQSLSIKCFEYRTIMEQRLLSNGDYEVVPVEEVGEGSDVDPLDLAKYKQTLHMVIN